MKLRTKQGVRNMSIPILSLLLTVGLVAGAWLIYVSDTATLNVNSTMPLVITENLGVVNVDTTNETQYSSDSITFKNQDGDLNTLHLSVVETVNDVEDECDPTGDLNVNYTWDMSPITLPADLSIPAGEERQLTLEYGLVEHACPCEYLFEITLQET